MSEMTRAEIDALQGTRKSSVEPWMSYASEFDEHLDPKLEAEIAEYSKHRHDKSSAQNEEELARQHEINVENGKQYQWVTPDEYADEGPRIGRIMTHCELINKLRNECGVQCWYREHAIPRMITLVYKPKNGGDVDDEPQVACWVQSGFMPEYSIMRFDEWNVPTNERLRGWRTCLLQLILKGIITEEQADKAFGKAHGPASTRYLSLLFEFRNRKVAVI